MIRFSTPLYASVGFGAAAGGGEGAGGFAGAAAVVAPGAGDGAAAAVTAGAGDGAAGEGSLPTAMVNMLRRTSSLRATWWRSSATWSGAIVKRVCTYTPSRCLRITCARRRFSHASVESILPPRSAM